ncbi:RmlC-like cupin domain-containing protein [Aspergillus pseudoustus]|uniref:RmlC-like cupin domain-containing protein n=1 Tax=Aspergillus pseudoustus TaxID=1810923 RepID=A0ABR4JWX6_9EURO
MPESEHPSTFKAPQKWFVGDVWVDKVLNDENMTFGNVTFTPCARTNWHTHEGGQILRVLAGSGWVCDRGGEPQRLRAGDMVWCPPGTTHWHGAANGSFMTHLAISIGGTEWLEAVDDQLYSSKG